MKAFDKRSLGEGAVTGGVNEFTALPSPIRGIGSGLRAQVPSRLPRFGKVYEAPLEKVITRLEKRLKMRLVEIRSDVPGVLRLFFTDGLEVRLSELGPNVYQVVAVLPRREK